MKRKLKKAQKHKIAIGAILLLLFWLAAVVVPQISPYTYEMQDVTSRNLGSSSLHFFGTDKFGRDILVRVCIGVRISLQIGIGSAILNVMIGILYGGMAGYCGKRADMLWMRIADIISAIPSLLYMILIMLVLGSHTGSIILGLCVSGWIGIARVVRSEILRLKQSDYCMAARMSGNWEGRIIWKQLIPNMKNTIIVNALFMVPQAIFAEAFLSFVGIGLSAPAASLGTMIQEARSQIQLYPMQMVYPIVVLCILIFAFQLIGLGVEE